MRELNFFLGLQIKKNKRWLLHQLKKVHQGSSKKIWNGIYQNSQYTNENINKA